MRKRRTHRHQSLSGMYAGIFQSSAAAATVAVGAEVAAAVGGVVAGRSGNSNGSRRGGRPRPLSPGQCRGSSSRMQATPASRECHHPPHRRARPTLLIGPVPRERLVTAESCFPLPSRRGYRMQAGSHWQHPRTRSMKGVSNRSAAVQMAAVTASFSAWSHTTCMAATSTSQPSTCRKAQRSKTDSSSRYRSAPRAIRKRTTCP
mmetsp:Transcript_2317/g.6960  ORF Transcript_2317/g.6960 Transcript_2317/m.6960 type:complete len:204 (-) Transcript_2317:73-684(-)